MSTEFKFKPGLRIGALTAENDAAFLHSCFIDTGSLSVLRDPEHSASIVRGRTGCGKTAITLQLRQTEDEVIDLDAENLSFNFVANSDIVNFLDGIGVNLNLFFRLLWQHIITVELLRHKYHIKDRDSQNKFLDLIRSFLASDERKKVAFDYLQKYGDDFWIESGVRAREITKHFEDEVAGNLGVDVPISKAGLEVARKWGAEERSQVVERAQKVVNEIQIRELSKVIDFLAEDIFSDRMKITYLVIDRLDENWIGSSIKYKLIRSLIECIKKFRRIHNLKIVLCIRPDLLDRIVWETKDLGFQSEKYDDLYLNIKWTRPSIVKLIDERINQLVRERYTKKPVGIATFFPSRVGKEAIQNYLVQRTFMRPRDAIKFVNTILDKAVDKPEITQKLIREAEPVYSRDRLLSLEEEWITSHPCIGMLFGLLRRWRDGTLLGDIPARTITDLAVEVAASEVPVRDEVFEAAEKLVERGGNNPERFAGIVFATLYKTGAIGIKVSPLRPTMWSDSDEPSLQETEITPESKIYIHRALYSALGVISPS